MIDELRVITQGNLALTLVLVVKNKKMHEFIKKKRKKLFYGI